MNINKEHLQIDMLAQELIKAGIKFRCLRDLTCGGPANTLIELPKATEQHFEINETVLSIMPMSIRLRDPEF